MLNIYLWGTVVMTATAVVFAGEMRAPAFLAGLLWPVVVVGVVQMLLIHLLAKVIRASGTREARPLSTMTGSNAGAAGPVAVGSHS